ncbi:MAG: hypothetical protein GEV08_06995 [Acidimicrobiia bacterium]|nr:hypothetical protein [Acidimicrobiia bacterium]
MGATGKRITVPISVVVGGIALVVLAAGLVGALTIFGGEESATYEVDFSVSEPTRENRLLPDRVQCPTEGRLAAGSTDGPLPGTSFAPTDETLDAIFAPGQVVAFQYAITVAGNAPDNGALDLEVALPRATAREMGFDPDRKVLCAFVDSSDPSNREADSSSPAVARSQDLPPTQESIRARLAVQALDPGDRVVVEMWVAAPRGIPETSPTLESRLLSAEADQGRRVKLVRDTVSYRINFFDRAEEPVLTFDVNDTPPDGVSRTERVDYVMTVTNTSAEAIAPAARLDAFIDEQISLAAVEPVDQEGAPTTCSTTEEGGFACDLGFVNPGEVIRINAQAGVKPEAERRFTKEDQGCQGENVDVCSRLVLTWFRSEGLEDRVEWEEASDIPDDQPLSILKLVPRAPFAYPGQKVDFTYQVANAGPTGSFNQLRVSDTACPEVTYTGGDANGNSRLDPLESWTYACSVAQMSEEMSRGDSRVDAFTDDGRPIGDSVSTRITIITPNLGVNVQPVVDNPGMRSIVVTNAGDADLTNLALSPVGCAQPPTRDGAINGDVLEPGGSWSYTCPAEPNQPVTVRVYATDPLENAVTATATSAN